MAYEPLTKEQFEQARKSGFSPEKIVQMEQKRKLESGVTPRQERIDKGLPVGTGDRATPTMAGNIIRDIARAPATLLVRPAQAIAAAAGFTPEEQTVKSRYLGDIKPATKAKDVISDVGRGLETISLGIGGGATKSAVGIAKEPFKRAVLGAGKQLAKEGALAGGVQGFGSGLTEQKGVGDVALKTIGGTLGGGLFGGLTGVGTSAISRGLSKIPTQELKRRTIEATSKALGISGKRPATAAIVQPEKITQGLATIRKYAPEIEENGLTRPFDPKTSENLFDDTLKALITAKNKVFRNYDDIASQAGKKGATIDLEPLENALSKYTKGITTAPKRARAERLLAELRSNFPERKASPSEMQDYIQLLNEELGGVSGGAERGAVGVVADFTRKAREAMDNEIGKLGNEYQSFRDEYASLKSIEDSLVRQYQKALRKKGGGLSEYADMIANAEMLGGIVSGNPALMAKSAALKMGAKFIKGLNDPERWLREAFDGIDNLGDEFSPKSQRSLITAQNISQTNLPTKNPTATATTVKKNPIRKSIQQKGSKVKPSLKLK